LIILILAIATALAVAALLSFGPLARSRSWRATVTPLASIIGSGFLVCGPLLAKQFGSAAIGAEAVLLAIAYAVGIVIRFNIAHVEPYLAEAGFHDGTAWLARVTQTVLSLAYAVSVAYYLKLLAEFGLRPLHLDPATQPLISNLLVTGLIGALIVVALLGDILRVEHVAHATVSVKLGVIAGLLVALGLWWATHVGVGSAPPVRLQARSIPVLLGLIITVQGFETSRYLGHAYDAPTRIRTMRRAQWISTVIYALFLVLLTPFLSEAARAPGVAGILDIVGLVAPFLGLFVLVGAISSQLSAAVADSIGAAGLMSEVSRRKLSVKVAFVAASMLAIAVVWMTDPYQVIALSSRAFALYYALQCAIGFHVSRRTGVGGRAARAGMAAVGLVCVAAALLGAPAD
jgi:hypothetical protein